jgi:quercetin dioxygenase-like cupin family protein
VVSKTDVIAGPADGKTLSLGGLGVIYKVMPEDTGGALAVVEHPMEPFRLVRPHTHAREDEISYVTEGEFGLRIGDRELVAKRGDWVFKPRGVMHTFWNPTPIPARLIEIITPGAFAHYFEKLASILGTGGPPDEAKLAELGRSYEITYDLSWVPALKAKYGLRLLGEP